MPIEWLSISEAANLLGVHPGTVRKWSDLGALPVHRTQGGHRRYLSSEIELWLKSQNHDQSAELDRVVQQTLRNTRFKIHEGRLNSEPWYNKLDEEARRQYRISGRSLLQGLINAVTTSGALDVADAEALGYEYASRGWRYGLSSVEATHAYLFFRNLLMDSMLMVYESAVVRSPSAWGEMTRRIMSFTDHILLRLLETYESYQRGSR